MQDYCTAKLQPPPKKPPSHTALRPTPVKVLSFCSSVRPSGQPDPSSPASVPPSTLAKPLIPTPDFRHYRRFFTPAPCLSVCQTIDSKYYPYRLGAAFVPPKSCQVICFQYRPRRLGAALVPSLLCPTCRLGFLSEGSLFSAGRVIPGYNVPELSGLRSNPLARFP